MRNTSTKSTALLRAALVAGLMSVPILSDGAQAWEEETMLHQGSRGRRAWYSVRRPDTSHAAKRP